MSEIFTYCTILVFVYDVVSFAPVTFRQQAVAKLQHGSRKLGRRLAAPPMRDDDPSVTTAHAWRRPTRVTSANTRGLRVSVSTNVLSSNGS